MEFDAELHSLLLAADATAWRREFREVSAALRGLLLVGVLVVVGCGVGA